MNCTLFIYFALLATFYSPVAGKLIVTPRDTDVKVNQSTYFNCSTNHGHTAIFWYHGSKYVYTGLSILEPYNERFMVDRYVWHRTYIYNLVIHSVQTGDAGEYICADDEGVGEKYSVQLVVLAGKLIVRPRDTDAQVNQSTYFNCSTNQGLTAIFWYHGTQHVYTGRSILEPYNQRFMVDRYEWNGTYIYNLIIHSVQPSDAGEYSCAHDEGVGEKYSVQLVVLDGDPICRSNIDLDEVIGQNSCNLEPDEVQLSCSVTYHGNIPPQLEWQTDGDDNTISEGLSNVTSASHYHYILKLKGDVSLDKSSYICETTRIAHEPRKCISEVINVLYALSYNSTVNRSLDDEVLCQANTSQTCKYKWRWFQNNDVTTESSSATLKPRKPGLHKCEAECYLRSKTCNLVVMEAMVYAFYGDTASSQMKNVIASVVSVVVVLSMVFALTLFFRHRIARNKETTTGKNASRITVEGECIPLNELSRDECQSDYLFSNELPDKYKFDPDSTEIITIKAAEEPKKCANRVAILDNEIFIVTENNSNIEVYDSMKFSVSRRLYMKELNDPLDIVSSSINKCLYIFNLNGHSKEILRVDKNGKLINIWSTGDDWTWSLSVTDESNVILSVCSKDKLKEYSPDGHLIREINLSDADIHHPWHAIKLTNGHFLVSHGSRNEDMHRVCLVDADGKLIESFGGRVGSNNGQMDRPVYLSVDGNGFVLVVDKGNSRVLLLDSDLKFKREILTKGKNGLRFPQRILLHESTSRALVVEYESGLPGLIWNIQFRS